MTTKITFVDGKSKKSYTIDLPEMDDDTYTSFRTMAIDQALMARAAMERPHCGIGKRSTWAAVLHDIQVVMVHMRASRAQFKAGGTGQ